MNYNPQIHNRQSIRLKNYDYSSEGVYFVTLCVQDRAKLFGTIENGEMQLNSFGKIVADEWEKSDLIRGNITMGEYIIMPDHFHGIIQINKQIRGESSALPGEFKSPSHTIGAIIRGFKGAATKRIKSILFASRTGESPFAPVDTLQPSPPAHNPNLTGADESPFAPADTLQPIIESQFVPEEILLLKKMNPNKSIWQRNYHERIIRDPRHLNNTINYIKNNPIKWELKNH